MPGLCTILTKYFPKVLYDLPTDTIIYLAKLLRI